MHPYWNHLEDYLTNGFSATFKEVSEIDCIYDINKAIKYRNYKSTNKHTPILIDHMRKEVRNGFQFPFDPINIYHIKDDVVTPQGMVVQSTLDEFSQSIPKYRLIHD